MQTRAQPRAGALGSPADALGVYGVQVNFGGLRAVDVDELRVPAGSITGIIGANGAGKTTLLDVVSGFVTPDAGSVLLHGSVELVRLSPAARARAGLGRLFQDAALFSAMSVSETLAVALHLSYGPSTVVDAVLRLAGVPRRERAVRRRVDELIELMGIGSFADKFVHELSTGSRRIVEIACILALRPRVVLLDEPSSGIAQREVESLAGVLQRVKDELDATFLIIEHDIPLIRGLSQVLYAMDVGRVIACGTPDEVLSAPEVIASYLGTEQAVIERSGVGT